MVRILSPLVADGATQMATDEALLEAASEATIRLYYWNQATLSLGYFQDYHQTCQSLPRSVPVVRRITGGGAIWHEHEVTYALVGTLG
ncbi:MAG: lipoyl protein ligase domain-containing protein [Planctomycetota bacterium]|jgi:lipoate-protein ligase A